LFIPALCGSVDARGQGKREPRRAGNQDIGGTCSINGVGLTPSLPE
jgi:hypothetical protein